MDTIELGDIAKDSISGLTGVVIADTMWLNGCRRVTLQPPEMKDGKPIEAQTFDEDQLVLVSAQAHASKGRIRLQPHRNDQPLARTGTGGPSIAPTRPRDVR
ncbi:MAG: hypothetical protein ABIS29_19430 [Vicinamibacterales bacterium]